MNTLPSELVQLIHDYLNYNEKYVVYVSYYLMKKQLTLVKLSSIKDYLKNSFVVIESSMEGWQYPSFLRNVRKLNSNKYLNTQNIPNSVSHLKMNYIHNRFIFPKLLKSLEFDMTLRNELPKKTYCLRELIIGDCRKSSIIPDRIKKLVFSSFGTLPELPQSIKYLKLPVFFNDDLPKLPNLITLIFQDGFNQKLNDLSPNLKFLKFGKNFNQPLDNLPNLIKLILGTKFDQSINNLPETLTHLSIIGDFKQKIEKLPNLLYFRLGNVYSLPLVLPNSLIHLSLLGDVTIQIPSIPSLYYLKLNSSVAGKLESLTHLTLMNNEFDRDNFPELIYLDIGDVFAKIIKRWPKKLRILKLGKSYIFDLDNLPGSLKKLDYHKTKLKATIPNTLTHLSVKLENIQVNFLTVESVEITEQVVKTYKLTLNAKIPFESLTIYCNNDIVQLNLRGKLIKNIIFEECNEDSILYGDYYLIENTKTMAKFSHKTIPVNKIKILSIPNQIDDLTININNQSPIFILITFSQKIPNEFKRNNDIVNINISINVTTLIVDCDKDDVTLTISGRLVETVILINFFPKAIVKGTYDLIEDTPLKKVYARSDYEIEKLKIKYLPNELPEELKYIEC